jgi:hypothetical protein
VSACLHSIARQFADKGTSAPIELDRKGKKALLDGAFIVKQTRGDEIARDVLPLRDALRADLANPAV